MFFIYAINIALAFSYIGILFYVLYYWNKIPKQLSITGKELTPAISILIPARNEGGNIDQCLKSIINQSFPKQDLEVIVIDDFSTDLTLAKVKSFQKYFDFVRLIQLSEHLSPEERLNSYKKKALEIAIAASQGAIIVTTDADCWMDKQWLKSMVSNFRDKQVQFVAAPVQFEPINNALEQFQLFDFIGMMGLTGGGIQSGSFYLCNGANLAFRKSAFESVGGYQGDEHFASGDDVFLLNKIARKYPDGIRFAQSVQAIVKTKPQTNFKDLVQQRLRWATKNSAYRSWKMNLMQLIVFTTCVSILVSPSLWYFDPQFIYLTFVMITFKALGDYYYLSRLSSFFDIKIGFKDFVSNQLIHLFYISGIGLVSLFIKKYTWKGRQVR